MDIETHLSRIERNIRHKIPGYSCMLKKTFESYLRRFSSARNKYSNRHGNS